VQDALCRLLVFRVHEGWTPLCDFLKVIEQPVLSVPSCPLRPARCIPFQVPAERCPSVPFPWVNDRETLESLESIYSWMHFGWPLFGEPRQAWPCVQLGTAIITRIRFSGLWRLAPMLSLELSSQ
jgi:hypothetical protein